MSQPNAGAPVPLVAEVFGNQLAVLFDRELLDTSLVPSNWTMTQSGQAYYCDANEISINQVLADMIPLSTSPGPNRCSYAASPPDVLALNGTPAAPFTDFPIT